MAGIVFPFALCAARPSRPGAAETVESDATTGAVPPHAIPKDGPELP